MAGRNRVPRPAAGITALVMGARMVNIVGAAPTQGLTQMRADLTGLRSVNARTPSRPPRALTEQSGASHA
ncbi:hypothetical protein ACFPRL_23025 [Pseudoclavibacter helvolus]